MTDLTKHRADFPILSTKVYDKDLVYLDNAATTQKPQAVIDRIVDYYQHTNSNVHRGVHALSQKATREYDEARETVRRFINAAHQQEVIFTRGTTEAVNLVAHAYGTTNLGEGDEILLSHMEHHSNIVPWQMLCDRVGATIKVIPVNDRGELDMDAFRALLSERTRLVGIVYVSNALGTINPVKDIISAAHAVGAKVLVDAAQATPHTVIDVQDLDCDFLAFSGHKVYGPTGIGALYGKQELLDAMPPFMGGGDMISMVSFEKTTFNHLPNKFEAGTPNIADTIGLAAALDYVSAIGVQAIADHEQALLHYATDVFAQIDELRIIGTAEHKAGVISFTIKNIHPHDVGTFLDREGVAIRAGHHCVQPLMKRFGVPATNRVSFALYNTRDEIDRCVEALKKVISFFA